MRNKHNLQLSVPAPKLFLLLISILSLNSNNIPITNATPTTVQHDLQQVRTPSPWNTLIPKSSWPTHINLSNLQKRQSTSGNRTEDLFNFFNPVTPPEQCSLECDIIWGAVGACELRSCVCTEQYGHEFVRCCECLMEPPSDTNEDYYQGLLNEFGQEYCAGYDVPQLTLSAGGSTTAGGAPDNPPSGSPTNATTVPGSGSTDCGTNCNGGGLPPPTSVTSERPISTSASGGGEGSGPAEGEGTSQDVSGIANGATSTGLPNVLAIISAFMLLALFSGVVVA